MIMFFICFCFLSHCQLTQDYWEVFGLGWVWFYKQFYMFLCCAHFKACLFFFFFFFLIYCLYNGLKFPLGWHCLLLFYLAEPRGFLDSWGAKSAIKDIILRLGSRPGFTFYLLFLWSWASHETSVDFNFHIRLMELMPDTPGVIVSWLNCSQKVLRSWSFFSFALGPPWYNRTLHSIHYLFSDTYSVLWSMVGPTPPFLFFFDRQGDKRKM